MYGTSPTSGWDSGIGIRSHSPFVMTSSVVHISLKEKETERIRGIPKVEMLVLSSDGKFGVYSILPVMKLLYKGDILAPMNQMRSSISNLVPQRGSNISLPELARIFITDSEHLLLVLSHPKDCSAHMGGMVQGFVYNRSMEVWARVSDERFLYSNFYTTVPTSKLSHGLLSSLDETVKGGRNGRQSQRRGMVETSAAAMYYLNEDDESSLQLYATRAHCEDRLACALALQSSSDFKHWFCLYIRLLCMEADSNQLRFIIDMLLNERDSTDSMETSMEIDKDCETSCWWLLPGSDVLGHKKRDIVEKVIIPEMSKNRSLQRLMNEIATELNSI
jgi:protein HIRA/HIR1